eukprot:UN23620
MFMFLVRSVHAFHISSIESPFVTFFTFVLSSPRCLFLRECLSNVDF